ncbi:MAG TPA: FtsX-like permease family protein, partial [Solirubrobacteraceae bacterium]|nr:FtsX-like permease family protein [Solirubrobacteraceae bacterium]
MLRAAGRLIRADLRERRLQTALTGLVVGIAACALLITLHLRDVMSEPFDDVMRGTNGAHVIVSGPPAAVAEAAALPEVAEAAAPRRLVPVSSGDAAGGRLVVSALPADAAIDRPLVTDGRLPQGAGEVALLAPLATGAGRRPGDEMRLGGERLEVVGVAITAIPSADAWVAPEQAAELVPAPPEEGDRPRSSARESDVAAGLRLRDPEAATEVAQQLAANGRLRVGDWLEARSDFTDDARRNFAILASSTVLALLATGFTLATAIGGRAIADRRRIGLLRSVGVTPAGVTTLLVGHYVAIALLAAPVGLLTGRLLAPALLDDSLGMLGMMPPGPPSLPLAFVVLLLVLLAVALACALPAWRAGRLPPVVALQPTRGGALRASRAARAARALRLPVTGTLGAKDAYIRPVRATLTVASLALAAAMVVCVLAFEATIDRLVANPALEGEPWDAEVYTEAMRPAEVDRLLASVPELRVVGRRYNFPAVAEGIVLETRAIDGPPGDFAFVVPDGRGVRRAGEVTLGRAALDALGVAIGDTVELAVDGRRFEARVVGRHVEPSDDGLGAVTLAGTVPAAALGRPAWILRLDPGADAVAVTAAIDRLGEGRLVVDRPADSAAANPVRAIVYGVAALLLAIAAINLLTTLLLGVRERRRDLAVLGAVGASRRQLTGTVVSGGLVLAVPAVVVGLPLGAVLFTTVVRMTDNADGADVATLPSWLSIAIALPVALAAVAA